MQNYLTIHQTEAHLKAYKIPVNCFVPIKDKPSVPAFCSDGILSLYMVMVDESIFSYQAISDLIKEYNVKKVILRSCYSDDSRMNIRNRLVKRVNSNIFTILPDSIDTYMSQLGGHTRRHVRSYERKFFKDFGSAEFITGYNSGINKEDYKEIIKLSRERCSWKGFTSGVTDEEIENLFEVIKLYGVVSTMKLNNKVIAGNIGTILEDQMTFDIIGHDNAFNDYNIGNIMIKKTVEQAIKDKIHILNFSWGGLENPNSVTNWKLQFGNQRWFLNDITYFSRTMDYYLAKIALESKIAKKRITESSINFLKKVIKFTKQIIRGHQ
jgi:hypothetical protein